MPPFISWINLRISEFIIFAKKGKFNRNRILSNFWKTSSNPFDIMFFWVSHKLKKDEEKQKGEEWLVVCCFNIIFI